MKLYPTLHATAEFLTEKSGEECGDTMKIAVGTHFLGKEQDGAWELSHIDRNLFRPVLRLQFVPDDDGLILAADYKPDRMLLIFMLIWSLVVIAAAVWKGLLLLVMLPVFWAVMIVGFSRGVRTANDAILDAFGATEILG
ncbi:MAG: hypothetical protein II916_03080 [Oscillospiraceae bacterium]|nr:hypothetical protein [Oscillospiraceae bacterium]